MIDVLIKETYKSNIVFSLVSLIFDLKYYLYDGDKITFRFTV